MLDIASLHKLYDCPVKANRQVDDSGGMRPYQRVDALAWSAEAAQTGKRIKIKGLPQDHHVQLFRVVASTRRTDWGVTNDPPAEATDATQAVCDVRWKIEQLPREGKQLTGWERCQCRKARIQRNHIACAFLVWGRLKVLATQTCRTVYQLKHSLLNDYLVQQLKNPSVKMMLA